MRPTLRAGGFMAVAAAGSGCSWSDPLLTILDADAADRVAIDGSLEENAGISSDEAGACSHYTRPAGADAGLNDGLVAWYRFEAPSAATSNVVADASDHGHDAKLLAASDGGPGYSFISGKVGDALALSYANQGYVALPAGLLAGACEATIATWVYVNSNTNAWTRIWDFGNGTKTYMFLTPITNVDDLARFGISIDGNTHEDDIKGQAAVPTLEWAHVAVVLGPSGGALYLNGEVSGSNPTMPLRPADLGSTSNNFIGRSQFSDDPYLDATIDEFRVYDRALSSEEIAALAGGS